MDEKRIVTFGAIMEKHRAEIHSATLPPLKEDELLLKMETCNICTTDYQQWQGLRDHYGFPMAGGHEYCGIIVEKGERVNERFQLGDRVSSGCRGCGYCDACRLGNQSECKNPPSGVEYAADFLGGKGFANYKIIKQSNAFRLTKNIPAAEASFLEPVATVVQGIRHARIAPTETVVVIGAGTMGLVNAQVARAFGARVIITDISKKKVERANQMGIATVINAADDDPVATVKDLTGGQGADVVIAAVGSTLAYQQAMEMLTHFRGRFLIFPAGYPKPELHIDPNEMHYRKTEIIGSYEANEDDYVLAARLLNYGMIDMQYSLEGKVFPLREINAAFEAAATPDTYRITVDLQDI
ncbi:zinc-binding dehydrogenase [Eubacteriales bacterium OttesenSCG-928-N14]|nr:zinc-binding dehydrogenase [Eubacteriales bacterium OttesenSCG-928-N14]